MEMHRQRSGPGRNIKGKSEFSSAVSDDAIIDGTEVIPTNGRRVMLKGNIKGLPKTVFSQLRGGAKPFAIPLAVRCQR